MPIYEYHCDRCARDFEVTQKISDGPLAECPTCSGPVEKLISQSSFVLKGSGWYLTDYARKDKGSSTSGGTGACADSGSKASCASCPSSGD